MGNRSDGSLIGLSNGSDFDAAITFRQKPTVFMRLKGDCTDENLHGSFTASSSNCGFWKGRFTASQAGSGEIDERKEDERNGTERNARAHTISRYPVSPIW